MSFSEEVFMPAAVTSGFVAINPNKPGRPAPPVYELVQVKLWYEM